MTLASGCGTRTMVRIGGGNAKSLVVLALGGIAAYLDDVDAAVGESVPCRGSRRRP